MLRSNFFKVVLLICAIPYILTANDFSVRKVKEAESEYSAPVIMDSANLYVGCYYANSISVINKVTDVVTTVNTPGLFYHFGMRGKDIQLFSISDEMTSYLASSSKDCGKTWEQLPTEPFYSSYASIYRNNDSVLFFGCDISNIGTVVGSYDNYKTFDVLYNNNTKFINAVNPKDNIIFFSDEYGNLFRSDDFCKTVIADTTITAEKTGAINSIHYLNNKLFIVNPQHLYTCDELTNEWSSIGIPDLYNYSLASIKTDTSGNYYVVLTNYNEGRIMKSKDLVEWTMWCDVPSAINDIFYFTDNKFAITGLNGEVWIAEPIGASIASEKDANWSVTRTGNNWNICFNDMLDHSMDNITIVDINGKEMPIRTISRTSNSVELESTSLFMSGAYIINVSGAGYKTSKKIVVSE